MPVLDDIMAITRLRALSGRGASRRELLGETARLIRSAGAPYTSAYIYMVRGNELVLEAYDGRPTEHVRIPVGQGVCGTAVAEGRDQNVPDVTASGNYLACNLETRSELVVLIEKDGAILGQIDVDSDVVAGFDEAEHAATRRVADALAGLL